MTLPDGRQLCFEIRGSTSPNAKIVLKPSGLPGCRHTGWWNDQRGKQNGHTFVTLDRPGYGRSTSKDLYTVLEGGQDMLHLVMYLGYREYKIMGVSNGAPCALALAYLVPVTEVTGVLLVCPTSPPKAPQTGLPIVHAINRLRARYVPSPSEENLRQRHELDMEG